MAVFVLKDASLVVNSINLSAYVSSITLDYAVDAVAADAMAATNGHVFLGGLQNNSLAVTLNQDFASSTVAATLDALIGTTTTVVIKPTSAAVGATNPTYTISNAFLAATQPVAGSVGDLAQMSVTFQGGTLVKAVA
jgi:hypothetical protein|tara:strand:+ start:486 stop:896 length:411 start_codon:yes stop_codon:yes gene_type:complete